jgi:hypothetical protein
MGNGSRPPLPRHALLLLLAGGVGGVVVDLDHIVWGGRQWHAEALALGSFLLGYCAARLGGRA